MEQSAAEHVHPSAVTEELRDAATDLWLAVSRHGGAVGFDSRTTKVAVRSECHLQIDDVTSGRSLMFRHRIDGQLSAMCFLQPNSSAITSHWMELKRFMVHPSLQRSGLGHQFARSVIEATKGSSEIEQLHITVRDGLGLEIFWNKCGFRRIATLPRYVRLNDGEYCDVFYMAIDL